MNELKSRITGRSARIGVIGLGYVGLPLACLIANKGFKVLGADLKKETINRIKRGVSPINEPGLDNTLKKARATRRLNATMNSSRVSRDSDIIFVVVQTPIGENKEPELSAFKAAWKTVAAHLTKGKLLICESTIPPGTMKSFVIPILETSGLKAGKDFYLAYSPERAIPTKTLQEMKENNRIVGGVNKDSAELAALMYSYITSGEITQVDLETAEIVKIIENAYRDVNIAFANEVALLCGKLGVDAKKAIELANKHPRVDILSPGPGVGGHCIPKDPYFLIHSAKENNLELRLISSAREVNESMPGHVLSLIKKSLSEVNKDPKTSKVSILGIAYKGNTDDSRNSPAKPIVKRLMEEDCNVISHDPFVSQDFGGRFSNNIEEAIKDSDCIVFIADHDDYRSMDLSKLKGMVKKPCIIIDSRRMFDPRFFSEEGLRYLSLGG